MGDTAPDFTAETIEGRLSLHDYLGDSWGLFFSHPADFTPGVHLRVRRLRPTQGYFAARNTKLIGVSVDPVDSRLRWSDDVADPQGQGLDYPLVGDADRAVASLYGMIHPNALETATVRTVLVIGPTRR